MPSHSNWVFVGFQDFSSDLDVLKKVAVEYSVEAPSCLQAATTRIRRNHWEVPVNQYIMYAVSKK